MSVLIEVVRSPLIKRCYCEIISIFCAAEGVTVIGFDLKQETRM